MNNSTDNLLTKGNLLALYVATMGKFPQDQPVHMHEHFIMYLVRGERHAHWDMHLVGQWLAEGLSPSLMGLSLIDRSPLPREEDERNPEFVHYHLD